MHSNRVHTACWHNVHATVASNQMPVLVGVGPQVNKFERISSLGHQLSLVQGGQYTEKACTVRSNASWTMVTWDFTPEQNNRHPWKHYLLTTLLAGGNNISDACIVVIILLLKIVSKERLLTTIYYSPLMNTHLWRQDGYITDSGHRYEFPLLNGFIIHTFTLFDVWCAILIDWTRFREQHRISSVVTFCNN